MTWTERDVVVSRIIHEHGLSVTALVILGFVFSGQYLAAIAAAVVFVVGFVSGVVQTHDELEEPDDDWSTAG